MNATLCIAIDVIREFAIHSDLKASRGFADVLADRIVQAGTQSDLLAFAERLAALMEVKLQDIHASIFGEFVCRVYSDEASGVLAWLRKHPKVAAMLCILKREEYLSAVKEIEIEQITENSGKAPATPRYDIPLRMKCLSPVSHGADVKAGNATLFRRINVLSDTGSILSLPVYGGNALRGMMRDLLAEDFLRALGLEPRRDKPPVALWFFHALYAGGCLEENSKAAAALAKELGSSGAVKCAGIVKFRDMVPPLSLLGTALGNRIISGRVQIFDLRPQCKQWGTGEKEASELFDWLYITRHEDFEAWNAEGAEHQGMIVNTECLKPGVTLDGGINVSQHATDIEIGALGKGLTLLAGKGAIGAQNARGLGSVSVEVENKPASLAYEEYLQEYRPEILKYLNDIQAIENGSS